MRTPLSTLFTAPITLAGLLALAGCDAEPPAAETRTSVEGLDLTRYGVHDIVAVDGAYELHDVDGALVGNIAVHGHDADAELDINLHGHDVEVDWTDARAAMRCDSGAPMTVRAGTSGWRDAVQDPGEDLRPCDDALAAGFALARAAGLTPPWAAELEDQVAFRLGGCMTVSTWVTGSSCWGCAQEASNGRCAGCTESGGSCSSGSIYTTCTHTYCSSDSAPVSEGVS